MFPEKIPLTRFSRLAGLAGYWPDLLANDLSPGEKRTAQASSRPPRMRADRIIYIVLWAVVIVLKGVAIFHFRADSDETQHAHVVWGWATGQLQYRDLFDNHMPLFQVVMSPFMRVLGERADILIWLRLAMLPFYAASVWCVYKLAALLFNARVAAWTALYSAVWFQFFYTSTEFRPDDMWAALWLGSLLVAVGGKFTVRRAFLLGVLLGLTFSVSMKTVALVLALIPAGIIALSLVWAADPKSISTIAVTSRLLASVAGMLVAPLAIVLYFASENAFWIMYYCVIRHNMVPGLKKWGSNPLFRWTFPAAVPLLIAYAFLIRRQCRDISLAARRIVVILAPLLYLPILVSYWPEVTREDALPYAPLLPLAPVPLIYLLWAGWPRLKNAPMLWSFILPLAGACEILGTCHAQNLHNNRLGVMTHSIRDVLMLTHRDDYVMDDKGEYIFRPRPTYWVFEPLTVIRICSGSITEDLPARLEETGTKICYFNSARRAWPEVSKFIASNYIPFDPRAGDLGVAGKVISGLQLTSSFQFQVSIPAIYSVVSESGETSGTLDGEPYSGPRALMAGQHQFSRTAGKGRAAIILSDAVKRGFHPLFHESDRLIALASFPDGKSLRDSRIIHGSPPAKSH